MANHHHHLSQPSDQVQQLPQVLVLRPPICFTFLESHYSHRLNFLKAWESHLSLDQFLANHGGFVRALISSANGPPITSDILRLLPSLGFITTTSTGVDHVNLAECRKRGVAVSSAGNLFSLDVADMAVGLLIDVLRKISASDRFVRCGLCASSGDYHLGSKVCNFFIIHLLACHPFHLFASSFSGKKQFFNIKLDLLLIYLLY